MQRTRNWPRAVSPIEARLVIGGVEEDPPPTNPAGSPNGDEEDHDNSINEPS
ncbi:MAG: hypothetical protein R3B81_19675 [bacterium]